MSFENEVECSNPPIFARIGPSSGGYCIPVPPPSIPIITTYTKQYISSVHSVLEGAVKAGYVIAAVWLLYTTAGLLLSAHTSTLVQRWVQNMGTVIAES